MKVKIYGCRGSAVFSRSASRYGGNTSCMTLESGGEFLVIDAGSGLMGLQEDLLGKLGNIQTVQFPLNILLSHLHIDHIVGLGTFDHAWRKGTGVRIFTCSRDERSLEEQVCGMFSPPYWPVSLKDTGAVECVEIESEVPFKIGVFTVTPFEASHPCKTYSFHITDGRRTFVHLLDSEIPSEDDPGCKLLEKYCGGADLVTYDSAYSAKDYPMHKGWGHSNVKVGVEFATKWGCKHMIFAHFDQRYSDDELDSWREYFGEGGFIMARDGLEVDLR